MAFSTPYTDSRGVAYTATYCRATVAGCHKNEIDIQVAMYLDQSCAPSYDNAGKQPIECLRIKSQTQLELPADNPIEYAYKLLEASGRFPEAVWNI